MNSSLEFPDFFVIGAPRSGTTALCSYLARNPQICFSRPKEPHYFSRLDHEPFVHELKRDYLDRHFSHFSARHKAAGEGSVSYLYLPGAIERINRLNPEARFIVLLRNPLDMLPSYHLRMLFLLQEKETDFARVWELEPERRRGKNVPKTCIDARLLMYSEVARFGKQINRLFDVAGPDRSHVIVFDDLKADPLGTYKNVLEFLKVDYDGRIKFKRRYGSRMYRYRWLQRLLFVPATRGGKTMDTLQRRARKYNPDGSKRPGIIKRLTRFNRVAMSPPPVTPQMAEVVREALRPDVMLLSRLLERDLLFWFDVR